MKPIKFFIISSVIVITLIQSSTAIAKNSKELSVENYNIQKFVVDEANRQGIDPALALAIAKVESDFNPYALSHAGAKGVMQIMPATAEGVFGISSDQLFDAKTNIEFGIRFIKQLLIRYNQRTDIALSHYNGGSAVQRKGGGLTVIPATKKYVNKVLSARETFKYRAYQLSDAPVHNSLKTAINKEIPVKKYEPQTVSFRALPKNKTHAKKTIQQEDLPLANATDQALYEKMEHLRTLRLHNIMRNTKSYALTKNNMNYVERKLTPPKKRTASIREIPFSAKRAKVLSWEKIFN